MPIDRLSDSLRTDVALDALGHRRVTGACGGLLRCPSPRGPDAAFFRSGLLETGHKEMENWGAYVCGERSSD